MSDDDRATLIDHSLRPAISEQWRSFWRAFRYSMILGTCVTLCVFLILLILPTIAYFNNGEWWFPYLQEFGSYLFAVVFGMCSATSFFARLKSCKFEDEWTTLMLGMVPILLLLQLLGVDFNDLRENHPTELLHPFLFACILLFPWCSGFFWMLVGQVLRRSSPPMILPEE